MMDWQPIETAPKDGTWILGINNRGNCAVILWHPQAMDRDRMVAGWVHPFTSLELSSFWNGACGSVPVAWAELPRGLAAKRIVEKFSKTADIDALIGVWSMRPSPLSPEGEAWEIGAKQGWQWAQDEIEQLRAVLKEIADGFNGGETAAVILQEIARRDDYDPTHWMPLPQPPSNLDD